MATQYSNKPIVTNGLVYALDFGNPKTYVTGSTTAKSLIYDTATTIVTGSTGLPIVTSNGLSISNQWIQRSASLSALDPNGTFTICAVLNTNSSGTFFTQNSSTSNLSARFQSSASLSTGFTLSSGDFSRIYTGNFTGSQHITYRYSSGSIDVFINGIPVTASAANTQLTGSGLSNTLFISSGSLPFSGSLSSFYVYNRALSVDEIYQNFQVASLRYNLLYQAKSYTIDENLYQFIQTTGLTDTTTINALSTFISGLKSNGLWNKMVAIYPFVTSLTSSQVLNLKEPGIYPLNLTGSFSASAAGLTPTSSTYSINTIASNTPYALVTSQSAHLTLLSYDLPIANGFIGGNSARAVGGDLIVQSGSRVYHVYRNVGTSSFVMGDPSITNVEVLVVAGGGGGGGWIFGGEGIGGGGGAGGLVYSSSFSITPGLVIQTIVGDGGTDSTNGQNSQFSTITSIGGGRGGSFTSGIGTAGAAGGSGGGGGCGYSAWSVGGTAISGQGNIGASGSILASGSGGGGGAGSPGTTGSNGTAGFGGSGSFFGQYFGVNLGSPAGWFAGGGAGVGYGNVGVGGIGGGGGVGGAYNVSNPAVVGLPGVRNTGGGGMGGSYYGVPGGKGGSGIVVVSYDLPASALTGSGTGIYISDTTITGSVNGVYTAGVTGSGNIGLITVSRTGSGTFTIGRNTTIQNFNVAASGALSTNISLNTANLAGTSSLPVPAGISFASIGSGLTNSEITTYHSLISQLQTNLKRKNTLSDTYSGAAAAYSLRRIGPSGYTGPAIRVRRDSDNTLRDIGFTSDGQLDTVGLLDFVGTGSGFVTTWYDQSGNNKHGVGGSPIIVSSGSIFTDGIKPALRFRGSVAGFSDSFNTGLSISQPFSYITSYRNSETAWYSVVFNGGNNNSNWLYTNAGSSNIMWAGNTNVSTPLSHDLEIAYGEFNLANSTFYINNTLKASGNPGTENTPNMYIGGGNFQLKGTLQELHFYTGSVNSVRTDLNNNLNSYYKIYGSATASFDTDYSSFISATRITQPTQSAALETLVSDLKSYGLWNKMKAIYPMVTDKYNLYSNTENLSTGWLPVSSSITASNVAGPFTSNLVANRFNETSGSGIIPTVYQTITLTSGSVYAMSVYALWNNRDYLVLNPDGNSATWFDIRNGFVSSSIGTVATASITRVTGTAANPSGSWYRCAMVFTSSVSGPTNTSIQLATVDGSSSYDSTTVNSGSYIWGAQFENGDFISPYLSNTSSVAYTSTDMLNQMKYNLKSTGSFSGSYVGGWQPRYTGNKPDGVTTYMNTNLSVSNTLSTSSAHLSFYSRTNVNAAQFDMSAGNGYMLSLYTNTFYVTLTDGAQNVFTSVSNTLGFYLGSRTNNTTVSGYKNTNKIINNATQSSVTTASTIYIGSRGDGNLKSTKEFAFATIGDGLTDYEAKALYWIVQKYQTTLGRQVY